MPMPMMMLQPLLFCSPPVFRCSVFFAAFFDGWLTKGRAQIVGLFVLFDSSTQTHSTHHCRCQIALISLSCQITGTAGSKCLTSLVTQLKRYSWAEGRAPLDRRIAPWLVYFARKKKRPAVLMTRSDLLAILASCLSNPIGGEWNCSRLNYFITTEGLWQMHLGRLESR